MSETTMLNKEMVKALSVDELLELDVMMLQVVQAWVPKPTGIYRFEVKACSLEEYGESHAIQVGMVLHECIALNDESQMDAVGELPAEYKENYFIGGDSDYGIRAFRTAFADLVGEGETVSIRELMERTVGCTGEGLLKHTKRKNKDTGEIQEGNQLDASTITIA